LIGTGLGLIVFKNFKQKFVNCVFYILGRLKSFLVPKTLIGFLLIYIFFAFYLTNELAKSITLDNWDETYHLLVGNEKTGDRPWRGNVYNIKILNKAISENEIKKISHQASSIKSRDNTLVCLYELDQRKYFYDQTGLNPDLSWKNKAQNRERKNYKSISGDHWLETEYPVAKMINKIKGSSQFTLVTTVASDDTFQSGPARIVSISKDPYNQNMMLGQEGSDLVFRLRTPLTKRNGMSPELIAQNIFSDRKPHNIIITYNGRSILLFVDGKKKAPSLELSPGAVLWNYFFLTKAYDLFGYRWLYHVIISVPVFFLVWGLVKSKKAR
jgi:hypothetical protein